MKIKIDPIAELIIGVLIVRRDLRPSWVKTYDDAREFAEDWARRLRHEAAEDRS